VLIKTGTRRALPQDVRNLFAALAIASVIVVPSLAAAQDRVTLDEVIPALSGTELGAMTLGAAPPPGSSRVVRRSEVLNALRREGRPTEGFVIPRSTRIHRGARVLNQSQLARLLTPSVAAAFAPCTVSELQLPETATLPTGGIDVRTDANRPSRSGNASAIAVVSSGNRETRIPIRASVTCPAPAIEAGDRVEVVVAIGNVRASARGEARQPGRVGDTINVRIASGNRRAVSALVLNASTVEVIQ